MHELAAALVAADPVTARRVGALDPRTGAPTLDLPRTDPEHLAGLEALLLSWSGEATAAPGTPAWLEQRCVGAEVAVRLVELRVARPWARAPYWYVETLGDALAAVRPDLLPDEGYAASYVHLLRSAAGFLAGAREQLHAADVPPLWAELAVPAAEGLRSMVTTDLAALTPRLPGGLHTLAELLLRALAAAVEDLLEHSRTLASTGGGTWAVGEAVFTGLLRDYHCLDLGVDELWEHGWAGVRAAEEGLVELAAELDPGRTWQEQVAALRAERTPAQEFLTAYRSETERARRITLEHDLLTVPPEEACVVEPLPEFRRAGLPLGEMRTVPAYAREHVSRFFITPVDPHATPERRAGHERENCPTFVRSIVGHETYPGHHLQSVHHQLGTDEESFLRFFRMPLFVEGWGLYVEDLLEETAFGRGPQALFARRNRLWRALRVVIDTGLHTGRTDHEEAVALLMGRTGMDRRMATGEVDRYTRHDNPTYPSTYVLGRDLFHRLRERFGAGMPLGRLHDALLAHGSPPLPLLERVLEHELG
ncbi:DUF885 domain-containing protein [Ornithinimicrobium avium]|uniref:DUF885 domain-containing protein n=1 Tax=Ornithinimicrobium avium TaxID=2283195 RepID=A0A345NL45_9MICO|nr:DUF885 domain-containing protein [Ornithinimicrobium avium]AXH95753.1 DUF885 domain-containing protein [Ornithinimicrobium avium]